MYALLVRIEQRGLVDVEKVPSEKGPPRKVYSLNERGPSHLEEFWRTWSFLAERIEQLHRTDSDEPFRRRREVIMAAKWIEFLTGSLDDKKAYRQYKARIAALPEPYGTAAKAFERYFMYNGGITDGDPAMMMTMLNDFADLWERAAADETPVDEIVGDGPGRVRRGVRRRLLGQALDRQGARPPDRHHSRTRRQGRTVMIARMPPSGSAAWRSRSTTCTCCAASTSTSPAAASSPCSARTGRARPRS